MEVMLHIECGKCFDVSRILATSVVCFTVHCLVLFHMYLNSVEPVIIGELTSYSF